MGETYSGVKAAMATCEGRSTSVRRRRIEVRRFKYGPEEEGEESAEKEFANLKGASHSHVMLRSPLFGMTSFCGRRREMEDAVAIHPSFTCGDEFHFFAVYDGHGCSHVAMKCRDRLHELVKEEVGSKEWKDEWVKAMERSFFRMDEEAVEWNQAILTASNCRCDLKTPQSSPVGSTAIVAIVTADKIVVANCGDSRAVLCRNGKAIPLSSDHKPDRPDEQNRIEEAGGRVIYWDGPRVYGVLAMSRAIGDCYLKPYIISVPEVTVMERAADDDFLILASDGLWDVVSNDKACRVVRRCLHGKAAAALEGEEAAAAVLESGGGEVDKACSYASMKLAKLALALGSEDNVSVVVINLRRAGSGGGGGGDHVRGGDKE